MRFPSLLLLLPFSSSVEAQGPVRRRRRNLYQVQEKQTPELPFSEKERKGDAAFGVGVLIEEKDRETETLMDFDEDEEWQRILQDGTMSMSMPVLAAEASPGDGYYPPYTREGTPETETTTDWKTTVQLIQDLFD
mgnify:CR=1 FL=1